MPKRNYAKDDDDDDELVSNDSSAKRARTADSSGEMEDVPRTQMRSHLHRGKTDKGKGRAGATYSDDQDEDKDDDQEERDNDDEDEDGGIRPEVPEMDEEELDAQYGAAIRAQLENKKKVQGVRISICLHDYFILHSW